MSTQTESITSRISQANGWDRLTRPGGLYGKTVVSALVVWLMTDRDMHWFVSDMLVLIGPMGMPSLRRARQLVVKFDAKTQTTRYFDYDSDMRLHSQRYDSTNCDESFDLLVVPWGGDETGRTRLVYLLGED
jgi:hypothetical protein